MALDPDAAATALVDTWQHLVDTTPLGWRQREGGLLALATGVPVAMFNGIWVESIDPDARIVAGMFDRLAASGLPYCLQSRPGTAARPLRRSLQHSDIGTAPAAWIWRCSDGPSRL
jgi:hypothetical protein